MEIYMVLCNLYYFSGKKLNDQICVFVRQEHQNWLNQKQNVRPNGMHCTFCKSFLCTESVYVWQIVSWFERGMSSVQTYKISIQMYAWWYCIANVLQNVCIGYVAVSCFTIPLYDFWIVESEPMCTFQAHWFQQWILQAYIHSDTINQQTKTTYINNKISLFDMGFVAFSSSHTFQILYNTM